MHLQMRGVWRAARGQGRMSAGPAGPEAGTQSMMEEVPSLAQGRCQERGPAPRTSVSGLAGLPQDGAHRALTPEGHLSQRGACPLCCWPSSPQTSRSRGLCPLPGLPWPPLPSARTLSPRSHLGCSLTPTQTPASFLSSQDMSRRVLRWLARGCSPCQAQSRSGLN